MASLVPKKYSDALYRVGIEKNILDTLKNEVKDVREIFSLNKELTIALCHPQLPLKAKTNIIDGAFKDKISKELVALFYVMLRKSREEFILDVLSEFLVKCDEHDNISKAVITSASELNDESVNRIKSELEKQLKRTIKIETKVDESLIAGLKVKVDDLLFDRTIDGKIKKISQTIM